MSIELLVTAVFSFGILLGAALSALLLNFKKQKPRAAQSKSQDLLNQNHERNILGDLRRANPERCKAFGHVVHDMPLTFWSTALAGEAGELCNLIKKMSRGDEIPNYKQELAKEAADIVIYLDLLCFHQRINLQSAIVQKFNEVSDRVKSPIKL